MYGAMYCLISSIFFLNVQLRKVELSRCDSLVKDIKNGKIMKINITCGHQTAKEKLIIFNNL